MENNKGKLRWWLVVGLVVLVVCVIWYRYKIAKDFEQQTASDLEDYYQSLIYDNPTPLQKSFVESIKGEEKTAISQSQAYFITHRFFDNGGNIYEIYDFIQTHPELSFLAEAERIYPKAFEQIKLRKAPDHSTRLTKHAYLAYMQVLDKYGYAGPAGWGTTANLYIRLAWMATKQPEQFQDTPGMDFENYAQTRIKKAIYYASKMRDPISKIMSGGTSFDIPSRDIVVMLDQYGSTLRYFEALGVQFETPRSADEVFDYATEFARQYAVEFYAWTGFLNASTLNMASPHRKIAMEKALGPLLSSPELKYKEGAPNPGSLNKIVNARNLEYRYFDGTKIREDEFDIYGKTNIVSLAKAVPRFKQWLMKNGWEERDFEWE